MRFLLKNLVPVYLFEEKEVESGYVGTEVKDVYTKTAKGIVQPSVSTPSPIIEEEGILIKTNYLLQVMKNLIIKLFLLSIIQSTFVFLQR